MLDLDNPIRSFAKRLISLEEVLGFGLLALQLL